jgi:hypothetical protein
MQEVRVFAGEQPAIAARLLEAPHATKAINCRLDNGNLRALESPKAVAPQPTLRAGTKSLFLYADTHWFSFSQYRDIALSPIRQDQYDRVYFAGGGVIPQYTRNDAATSSENAMPVTVFTLGVPSPDEAPALSYDAPDTDVDPLDNNTRYYVTTYSTIMGEESAPSPVSQKLVMIDPDNESVTVGLPTMVANTFQITTVNVYRSATGGEDAAFFLVGSTPYGETEFVDTPDSELDITLATEGYAMPPEDLHALVGINGGMLVGATGKTVCVSEAYLPYAWKQSGQLVAKNDVVAIAPLPSGAIVATTGEPELLSGYAPDAMSLDRLELAQACISARSMVDMGTQAIYASPDGLVSASVEGARLVSESMIHRDQWQALNPASIHAYHHEGDYIGFYDIDGSTKGGFIFSPGRSDLIFLDFYADTGYRDLNSDKLYLLINDTLMVYRGDPANPLRFIWRSKVFDTKHQHYAMYRIKHGVSDFVGTTVRIITEDGEIHETVLDNEEWGYIPPGLYNQWQIEVESTETIEGILLGNSLDELGM